MYAGVDTTSLEMCSSSWIQSWVILYPPVYTVQSGRKYSLMYMRYHIHRFARLLDVGEDTTLGSGGGHHSGLWRRTPPWALVAWCFSTATSGCSGGGVPLVPSSFAVSAADYSLACCCSSVFVKRMLLLYIPTTEPLSKDTTVVYTWVQGHDTRTIVVPEAKVTTMEVFIYIYI